MNRVVVLSAAGYAALACLRVEGPGVRDLVKRHVIPVGSTTWDRYQIGDLIFGHWDRKDGEEVVVSLLAGAAVEIHCHGGEVSQGLLLDSLLKEGCQEMKWEEWLAHNSGDAIEKSAALALSQAKTHRVAMILIDQLHGALHKSIKNVIELLGDQNLESAETALKILLEKEAFGMHLLDGWRVVLIGHPNAGKSSLMNALLGYQRSIILSEPGTTRDVLTATTAIEGWPIELVDTAGLRSPSDPLEKAGMQLAVKEASKTDLVLLVSDASQNWTSDHDRWLRQFSNVLVVHNKQDLVGNCRGQRPAGIETVAVRSEGLEELCSQIVSRTVGACPEKGTAVPFAYWQSKALRRASGLIQQDKSHEAQKLLVGLLDGKESPKIHQ